MGKWTRQAAIAVFSAVILALVVWLGQVPMGKAGGPAILRLALRSVHARAEVCRERSAAELDALPQHMRLAEVCEQVAPPYRLKVEIDGRTVFEERIEPGGLRGDRPLIVDRLIELEPGAAQMTVGFIPVLDLRLEEAMARTSAGLPSYGLEQEIVLEADRITLITLDDATGTLEIYGGT